MPQKSIERSRKIQIHLYLNEEEAAQFEKLVKKSCVGKSSYIRHLIRGLVPAERPTADFYAVKEELSRIGRNLNQIATKAHSLNLVDAVRYDAVVKQLWETLKKLNHDVHSPRKYAELVGTDSTNCNGEDTG